MPSYNSTARVPFAKGGTVKKSKKFGAGGGVRGSTKSADIYSRIKQRHRIKEIRKNFKRGKK